MDSQEDSDEIELEINPEDISSFKRLDLFLCAKCPHLSRSVIKKVFEAGGITSTSKLELKKMPKIGTSLILKIPPPIPSTLIPENIPLSIVYEDEHIIVINKAAGMVTHPGAGNYTGTLVNAILFHCPKLQESSLNNRPGIAHRLDKGTTGLIVVAKSQKALEELVTMFAARTIEKTYHTLVMGTSLANFGTIKTTIGRHPTNRLKMSANVSGRDAITHYQVLNTFKKMTYLQIKLETGRTHQIRVHMAQILRAPILCDPLYGNPKENLSRLGPKFKELIGEYPFPFLHAKTLSFNHPITGERMNFDVDPPKIFLDTLKLAREEM